MLPRLPRSVRVAIVALAAVGAAWGLLDYRYAGDGSCSDCGAPIEWDESGLALSMRLRLPLRLTARTKERDAAVSRFLPAGHVHRPSPSTFGFTMSGPFMWHAVGCGGLFGANGFTSYLMFNPPFAAYLEGRISDGTLDLATIRELLAVPERPTTEYVADPRHAGLLQKGNELISAFAGADPHMTDIWWWK